MRVDGRHGLIAIDKADIAQQAKEHYLGNFESAKKVEGKYKGDLLNEVRGTLDELYKVQMDNFCVHLRAISPDKLTLEARYPKCCLEFFLKPGIRYGFTLAT